MTERARNHITQKLPTRGLGLTELIHANGDAKHCSAKVFPSQAGLPGPSHHRLDCQGLPITGWIARAFLSQAGSPGSSHHRLDRQGLPITGWIAGVFPSQAGSSGSSYHRLDCQGLPITGWIARVFLSQARSFSFTSV